MKLNLLLTPILICLMMLVDMPQNNAQTNSKLEIKEWEVPWEKTRPRDPYVDQKGRVWFCGQNGNYIAYLEPGTGEFKRFEMSKNTYPHNLIIDKEGFVWYAGNVNSHIGKLDPDNGNIEKFPMPDSAAVDPHTLVFNKDGDIWFTVQGGNFIGKLETGTGKIYLVRVSKLGSRPYGIKVDNNNRPWIVLFGTDKLATVDPTTMELEEIPLPRTNARPRRLEITSDGNIWYVDYRGGYLGRYTPENRQYKEWELPSGTSARPYGTALDDQNRIWIAETGIKPNRLVGFDTKTEEFISSTEIPSGGGSIRHMYYHPSTGEIWFGTDTNNIGKARIIE